MSVKIVCDRVGCTSEGKKYDDKWKVIQVMPHERLMSNIVSYNENAYRHMCPDCYREIWGTDD